MSDDARLSTGLPGHPKTKKLVKRLGQGAAWNLVCLILWARANRPDGDLSGMTAEDIELACDWQGENDLFVRTLVDLRFLDGAESELRLHDWAEHQPWAIGADLRSAKARWNAVKRHHGAAEADRQVGEWAAVRKAQSDANSTDSDAVSTNYCASSNADSMHAAERSNARSNAAALLQQERSIAPSPSPKAEPIGSSPSPDGGEDSGQRNLIELETHREVKARRLREVTQEAIETFNAVLGKPRGLLPRVSLVNQVREGEVKRSLSVAREICKRQYGSELITRQFWGDYWAAIAEDEFKSGRKSGGAGHESWVPTFEYLTRPKTMTDAFDKAVSHEEGAARG